MDAQLAQSPMVTQVSSKPSGPEEPGILLCVSQPGETLWDVAKRYRVGEEAVHALNPELTDTLTPGQGVVVWRRAAQ